MEMGWAAPIADAAKVRGGWKSDPAWCSLLAMSQVTGWLRGIEDSVRNARSSLGGPLQYLGMFPGAEPGVRDPHLQEYLAAGKALERSRADAFQIFESLALQGSVLSMLFLADAIRRGDGYRIDLEKSEGWYKHAASLGSGRAMYGLGLVHLARRDLPNAFEAWRSAGERGCGAAMWVLGRVHLHGDGGVAPDAGVARAFFEQGSSLGHVWSTRSLALLLMTGRFGLSQRLRGYLEYLGSFVSMLFAMFGKRADPVMR